MKKIQKLISIFRKYSLINTLLAYFKIPHPRAASVIVSQKGTIIASILYRYYQSNCSSYYQQLIQAPVHFGA